MAKNCEIYLLVTSEADIAPGLALALRIAERTAFHVMVTVLTEGKSALLEQVKSRLASLEADAQGLFSTESLPFETDSLLQHLSKAKTLQLLLVSGLDQLNDKRKQLLRGVHSTVICFESHPGLAETPRSLCRVGEDFGKAAQLLSENLVPHPRLLAQTIEQLQEKSKDDATEGAQNESHTAADWVLISCDPQRLESSAKTAKAAIEAAVGPVIMVKGEVEWLLWFTRLFIPHLVARIVPQMSREDRRLLADDLSNYSKLNFEFVALICSATFLASFGLVQDSAAVIIGAMLVAPLMTPILGAGLSLTQGNKPLFRSSLRTIAIGFLAALITSTVFGLLLRFIPNNILRYSVDGIVLTGEMWSRTTPSILDFLVGLVGGSAAAFARTRSHLSAALAGAAIAAALVPPIATAGLQLSMMFEPIAEPAKSGALDNLIYGPILLFLANMLTIMIGSSFVLWACGVRGEHSHSTRERWNTRTTVVLSTLTVLFAVWIIQHS